MLSYTLFRDYLLKERKKLSDLIIQNNNSQSPVHLYQFYSGQKKMLDEILIKLAEGNFQE
jgi:hypothetical protein